MDKQKEVFKYLQTVESATKEQIYENVPFGYYHNWQKHLGDVLSRMVKNGTAIRLKKCLYKAGKHNATHNKPEIVNPNQTKIEL